MARRSGATEYLVTGFFIVLVALGVYGLLQQRVVKILLPPPLPTATTTVSVATTAVMAQVLLPIAIPVTADTLTPPPARLAPEQHNDETLPAPAEVKAIYATAYTALSPRRLAALIDLIKTTELNAIVINVKDGEHTFLDGHMAAAIRQLREAGIYPIARIVVFQDNELAERNPAVALRRPNGSIWDGGGYRWVDPASQVVWDENVRVAEAALALGFAEINLDYVRFPADGALDQIVYPETRFASTTKVEIIRNFLDYFVETVKGVYPKAIISADIFGYTFLSDTDLGIGQRVVDLADAVDVIAPMVYPSHFSPNTFGYKNPAAQPYETVRRALVMGLEKLMAEGHDVTVRPWLQDFDLGAVYNAAAVREEMRAVTDAGLNAGWMIWSPQNTYDREEFVKKQ